jgi:hypothetical protein
MRSCLLLTAKGLTMVTSRGGLLVWVAGGGAVGTLPRDLPPSIRLIRRPWWWPSVAPKDTPPVLVMGTAATEQAFARLFRLQRHRICIRASDAVAGLPGVSGGPTDWPSRTQLKQS